MITWGRRRTNAAFRPSLAWRHRSTAPPECARAFARHASRQPSLQAPRVNAGDRSGRPGPRPRKSCGNLAFLARPVKTRAVESIAIRSARSRRQIRRCRSGTPHLPPPLSDTVCEQEAHPPAPLSPVGVRGASSRGWLRRGRRVAEYLRGPLSSVRLASPGLVSAIQLAPHGSLPITRPRPLTLCTARTPRRST